MKKKLKLGERYIFALVGQGKVTLVETKYTSNRNRPSSDFPNNLRRNYVNFDCGIILCLEDVEVNRNNWDNLSFNVVGKKMDDYINCDLYVFDSIENAKLLLPSVMERNLKTMQEKAEALLKEYMTLASDVTSVENQIHLLKKGEIEVTKL